jgi:adenylate kinase
MCDIQTKPDRAAWIKGPAAHCNLEPEKPMRAWRLVLLGPPGVGKGTQAELLGRYLGACHLSTGEIFRAAKTIPECQQTPVMAGALDYMRRGELVPDHAVLSIIKERLGCLRCRGGFLLDGFPRTVAQAEVLQMFLRAYDRLLDAVINYDLPEEQIIARLSGRVTCAGCRAVFHVASRPPQKAGVCDHCGGSLVQREDDSPAAVRVRLAAYRASTQPLIQYYERLNLLHTIDASGSPEAILIRTMQHLPQLAARPITPV